MPRTCLPAVAVTAVLLAGASGSAAAAATPRQLPQGSEAVTLDPADFTTRIDNPYWPMRPGNRWVFRESDPKGETQRVELTVTDRTKVVAGVTVRVVRDVATEGGRPVEVTDDYYAQDRAGNLWFFGEATTEYENGKPTTTKGSWEAGVGGAQAGVAIPGRPRVGMGYRQEYFKGEAEDKAQILSLGEQVEVPAGHFTRVMLTKDFTALNPTSLEYKFFAKGIGPTMTVSISGGGGRAELVRYKVAG